MKIKKFKVEEWMNEFENDASYNIAETCVDSVSINELFELAGKNEREFFEVFNSKRLTYGAILGLTSFKEGICKLYKTIKTDEVITTHGATGANHLVLYSLVEPGDHVISVMPTYQQLYSIPESFGAHVDILHLKKENKFLPDIDALRKSVSEKTKVICINNPNNPTGALIPSDILKEIVKIAREADSYILCDEVYRSLNQEDIYTESIADLYEKGISVSSMSKVFSLAGVRLGWIATHDKALMESCLSHRDYNMISCGMFDEAIASIALEKADILLDRSKKIVRNNLKILDEWIKTQPHCSYIKPKAGTIALLYYDIEMGSREFCTRLLKETGAFLTPGECFEQEYCARIGYACEPEELKSGLAALGTFIEKITEKNK